MAAPKINPQEQLRLRNDARAEMLRLETIFNDKKVKAEIDSFKDKFSICEITYKFILREHQYKKTGQYSDYFKVVMTQVPFALSFAGYTFDKALLTNLFGSEDSPGRMSVKKLRDLLNHSITPSALQELQSRSAELHGYMDAFLDEIRVFDAA